MRSRRGGLRVLLDTSFLLPSLGIDTGPAVYEALRALDELHAEVFYSALSLLEALWVAVRLMKKDIFDEEAFRAGLSSIMANRRYRRVEETPGVLMEALKLYELGHADLIDNMLYADARQMGLKLLTLDEELRDFILNAGLEDVFITLDELARLRR